MALLFVTYFVYRCTALVRCLVRDHPADRDNLFHPAHAWLITGLNLLAAYAFCTNRQWGNAESCGDPCLCKLHCCQEGHVC